MGKENYNMPSSLKAGGATQLPVRIGATELSAGTPFEIVAPADGYLDVMRLIIQVAIVTGGTITVEVNTVAVAGLSQVVPDAATKGTRYAANATPGSATRKVIKGDRITVTPSAPFNGGGAIDGFLTLSSADTSKAL